MKSDCFEFYGDELLRANVDELGLSPISDTMYLS